MHDVIPRGSTLFRRNQQKLHLETSYKVVIELQSSYKTVMPSFKCFNIIAIIASHPIHYSLSIWNFHMQIRTNYNSPLVMSYHLRACNVALACQISTQYPLKLALDCKYLIIQLVSNSQIGA